MALGTVTQQGPPQVCTPCRCSAWRGLAPSCHIPPGVPTATLGGCRGVSLLRHRSRMPFTSNV